MVERRRLLFTVPVVIGVALSTAACGGGSPEAGVASLGTTTTMTTAGTSGGGSSNPAHAAIRFARCMRAHGVSKFPEPKFSGASGTVKVTKVRITSTPNFPAATRACAKYAPPGAVPKPLTSKDRADYLRASDCMRSHGITGFPDPLFSGNQVTFPIPKGMNVNSPPFLRAREICELLIPPGLPYSKQAEGGQ